MNIHFATCNRVDALRFLKKVYKSRIIEDSPEDAGPMLDLVEKDIIRIQDPMMHSVNGTIQVIPGTHWDESKRPEITEVCRRFHERNQP